MTAGDRVSQKAVHGNFWTELEKLRREVNAIKAHPWGHDTTDALTINVDSIRAQQIDVNTINPGAGGGLELWNDADEMSGTNNGLADAWSALGTQTRTYPGNNKLSLVGQGRAGAIPVNISGLFRDAPDGPYTITCRVTGSDDPHNNVAALAFANADGAMWVAGIGFGPTYNLLRLFCPTPTTVASYLGYEDFDIEKTTWLRIQDDDNGGLYFYVSLNNRDYSLVLHETYDGVGEMGKPTSIGVVVTTYNGFASDDPNPAVGTFGPLSVDSDDELQKVGNVFSTSKLSIPDNFLAFLDGNGSNVYDSGVPSMGAMQYQVLTSGEAPFGWGRSAFLLSGAGGGRTALSVTSGKVLTLVATDNRTLTVTGNGSVQGSNSGDITLGSPSGLLGLSGQELTMDDITGENVAIDDSGFTGNLEDIDIQNAQELAEAVDGLFGPSAGSLGLFYHAPTSKWKPARSPEPLTDDTPEILFLEDGSVAMSEPLFI